MRSKTAATGRFLLTVALGSAGGWVMWHLHLPLAWLLGAMIATGLGALLGAPVSMPAFARPPMTAIIGAMLGTSFSPAIFEHAGLWLVSLGGLAVFIAVAGASVYAYFRFVAGFDHPTAFFSAMPGGLVEMVTLGAERGGDEKMIALIHAARIFLVVLSLPFLVQVATGITLDRNGADYVALASVNLEDFLWFCTAIVIGVGAGAVLRLPARYLLGPMLLSAIMHLAGLTEFVLPSVALGLAQVVIGATIGCRFAMASPRTIMKAVGLSIGSTVLLLCVSLAFAAGLSHLTGDRFIALVLAYSPGGVAEMSLIALSLGIEVPFVVLHHIARVFLVVAGSAAVFRLAGRGRQG
ncbi:AbrB family transcriptional regulator [Ensifer adhaerens]|uniref:AbrB family transcriptional regulator n=1 Tax=Ensifer adhaerens TaxID=106592 RepID=UPI0015C3AFA6|nr:AbrB family transcriptional regulator [Ensifer adhaerens]